MFASLPVYGSVNLSTPSITMTILSILNCNYCKFLVSSKSPSAFLLPSYIYPANKRNTSWFSTLINRHFASIWGLPKFDKGLLEAWWWFYRDSRSSFDCCFRYWQNEWCSSIFLSKFSGFLTLLLLLMDIWLCQCDKIVFMPAPGLVLKTSGLFSSLSSSSSHLFSLWKYCSCPE